MKKLIGILVPVTFASTLFAQEGRKSDQPDKINYPEGNKSEQTVTPQQQGSREFYVWRDKKLYHVKDNLTDEVRSDVTLSNGTKLTTKGEIISRTGKRDVLEDGQCVDMTATVSFCEASPSGTPPGKRDESQPEQKDKNREPGNK